MRLNQCFASCLRIRRSGADHSFLSVRARRHLMDPSTDVASGRASIGFKAEMRDLDCV